MKRKYKQPILELSRDIVDIILVSKVEEFFQEDFMWEDELK